MILTALVENTSTQPHMRPRHGLSLFIETENHLLLFDIGDNALFLRNAAACGIAVNAVDTLILSHGHVDHGGALPIFLKNNKLATVYVHPDAFQPHYAGYAFVKVPVGLDAAFANHDRLVFTGDRYRIDDELFLFSDVAAPAVRSAMNQSLLTRTERGYLADSFSHEQNLLITQEKKTVLITGCSHKGIVNILDRARAHCGKDIDVVIGGFHLWKPFTTRTETPDVIEQLGNALRQFSTQFYTCHCTGQKAYIQLKQQLGDQLHYLSAGMRIQI